MWATDRTAVLLAVGDPRLAGGQAELDSRYGGHVVVGTTTIDGDPADIVGVAGAFTVVGPVEEGRFLTLSGSGVTLDQLAELATHVHRQAPEHEAGMP